MTDAKGEAIGYSEVRQEGGGSEGVVGSGDGIGARQGDRRGAG